jgi:hypothetical protein
MMRVRRGQGCRIQLLCLRHRGQAALVGSMITVPMAAEVETDS